MIWDGVFCILDVLSGIVELYILDGDYVIKYDYLLFEIMQLVFGIVYLVLFPFVYISIFCILYFELLPAGSIYVYPGQLYLKHLMLILLLETPISMYA